MVSIINYLVEFDQVTQDMAFEAAKRLAKYRNRLEDTPETEMYKVQEGIRRNEIPMTSEGLSDLDKVQIRSGKGPATEAGRRGLQLLRKRFAK